MNKIEFVQQKCGSSCGIACVAMVSGVDFDTVLHWNNGKPGVNSRTLDRLLVKAGVIPIHQIYDDLTPNAVQIVTVPSLNIKAGTHYIVVDTRDENLPGKAGQWGVIYDPVKGREGKEFYTIEMLTGWGGVVKVESV